MKETIKISLHNVSFSYNNKKVLNEISLNIFRAERVCLLGANATGKSTLLKIIAGLLSPTDGEIFVDEKTIKEVRKGEICYVFQDAEYQIVASTVEADVAFGAENLVLPQKEIEKRVADSLGAVELLHKKYADVNSLSGGQKSCLVIADALAMKPSVLLLDDVTSHLDAKGQDKVEKLLQKLHDNSTTIISAEYSVNKIENYDRVIVMKNGGIVTEKKPNEIFAMSDFELAELGFLRMENLFA